MPVATETTAIPAATVNFSFQPVSDTSGERIVIYGTGGAGKSTLALAARGKQVWYDLDGTLGKLQRGGADISHVVGTVPAPDYKTLLATLNDFSKWTGVDTIVIDSMTVVEEFATQEALATRRHGKTGKKCDSLVDYGFGEGFRHLYDMEEVFLQACENHARQGRNIILIAHEGIKKQQNPLGDDFAKYCPDVLETKSYSFASRMIAWADHVFYIGYDITPTDKGKIAGSGTRAIYSQGRPMLEAKSRTMPADKLEYPYTLTNGPEFWQNIFNKGTK